MPRLLHAEVSTESLRALLLVRFGWACCGWCQDAARCSQTRRWAAKLTILSTCIAGVSVADQLGREPVERSWLLGLWRAHGKGLLAGEEALGARNSSSSFLTC